MFEWHFQHTDKKGTIPEKNLKKNSVKLGNRLAKDRDCGKTQ